MATNTDERICPVERAGSLDNSIRKLLQNPRKLLRPYIREGNTVLDLGCGPGFFSVEIAHMLSGSGKVIAADLQEGMLDKVRKKINGTQLERSIVPHACRADAIGVTESVDFVLAFYMIHEVPDHDALFRELNTIVKPDGRIFIVEPKFHVSQSSFAAMLAVAQRAGFVLEAAPKVFFSRAVLLNHII